jgi:hypothetical protein
MNINAIPTRYAGTQFRSRLEARWAKFFDLVNWRWEYEPLDLKGWIPDFALIGKGQTTLVEVKPIDSLDDPIAQNTCGKIEHALRASERTNEILLLGCIWPQQPWSDEPALGWLAEYGEYYDHGWCWGFAPFHHLGGLGFCHAEQSFRNRITGEYDGDSGTGTEAPIHLWREAGNAVQWMANGE